MIKKIVLGLFLLLFINPLLADEEVKITSQEILDALPLEWECTWKDKWYSGKYTIKWTAGYAMKKITGTATNPDCPAISNNFTAKIKKGKVSYKLVHKNPCSTTKGTDTVYKKSDGTYYIKGKGSYSANGIFVTGESHCVPK